MIEHGGIVSATRPGLAALLTVNKVRLFRRRHGWIEGQAYAVGVILGTLIRAATGDRNARASLAGALSFGERMSDLYQAVTDRMIAALERGTAPWVRPWSTLPEAIPMNAQSRRPYRGVNFALLSLEASAHSYPINRWLTYRQASELGGQVRRGEHGCLVVFWQLRHLESDEPELPERPVPIRFRKHVPTVWLALTIRAGQNRQVRRMTAAVGHPTLRLVRIAIGPVVLEDLEPGRWRELTQREIESIAHDKKSAQPAATSRRVRGR